MENTLLLLQLATLIIAYTTLKKMALYSGPYWEEDARIQPFTFSDYNKPSDFVRRGPVPTDFCGDCGNFKKMSMPGDAPGVFLRCGFCRASIASRWKMSSHLYMKCRQAPRGYKEGDKCQCNKPWNS